MKKLLLTISLLGISSFAMADLSASCKTYFDKVDNLIKAIPDNAATKQQTDMLKQNLEMGKKQVIAMSQADQENACKKGLEALKQAEAALSSKK